MAALGNPLENSEVPPPLQLFPSSDSGTSSTDASGNILNLPSWGIPLIILASILGPLVLVFLYTFCACYLPRKWKHTVGVGKNGRGRANLQPILRLSNRRITRNTYHHNPLPRPVAAHLPAMVPHTNLAPSPPPTPITLPPAYFQQEDHLDVRIFASEPLPDYEREAYPESLPQYDRIDDSTPPATSDERERSGTPPGDYHLELPSSERLEQWMAGVEAQGAVVARRWEERHQRLRRAAERGRLEDAAWSQREQRRVVRRAERRRRAEARQAEEGAASATYVSEYYQFSYAL
ncbi:hypothetical protein MMC13_006903 [Lambiella insularis]|nr:hypothetical protein [Lambiella insularis]